MERFNIRLQFSCEEANMYSSKKALVIALVTCLLLLPLGDVAASLDAATPPNPAVAKQQVDQYGVGAKVKIQLADGKKLKGSISAIEDEGFLLASKADGSPRRVAYGQVAQLKLAKLTYKAAGQLDPAEARRVVLGLGLGKHIMVRTAAGKEYHGLIVAIEEGGFAVMPDRESAPVQIAYGDVLQLGPNLSTRAKIAIVLGTAGAVLVVALLVVWIHAMTEGMEG
jgi:ribosome maturation factor RimP